MEKTRESTASELERGTKTIAEKIAAELERLPEPLAREVLDFIEYLEFKHGVRSREAESLKQAQQLVMDRLWNNEEDEVWNDL